MDDVSGSRRFLAIVVLLLVGFGMVALADALDEWWPLFITPIPYAIIPWLIVRHERAVAAATAGEPAAEACAGGSPLRTLLDEVGLVGVRALGPIGVARVLPRRTETRHLG